MLRLIPASALEKNDSGKCQSNGRTADVTRAVIQSLLCTHNRTLHKAPQERAKYAGALRLRLSHKRLNIEIKNEHEYINHNLLSVKLYLTISKRVTYYIV